jgi:hypothetical protein
MITHFDRDAVRYDEGGRPVAVGGQDLSPPTRVVTTASGFWGLYADGDEVVVVHPAGAMRGRAGDVRGQLQGIVGDEGRDGQDRETARSFLPFLGGDDPGRATEVPRSMAEAGPSPAYRLSDERNAPPAAEPPSPAERARRPGDDAGSRRGPGN